MKIKTADLQGPALDWAVAKAVGEYKPVAVPAYSTDWSQGGPIIEREEIGTERHAPCMSGSEWEARGSITAKGAGYLWAYGPTPLIAAMRCYVASKLGDEVEVPDALA